MLTINNPEKLNTTFRHENVKYMLRHQWTTNARYVYLIYTADSPKVTLLYIYLDRIEKTKAGNYKVEIYSTNDSKSPHKISNKKHYAVTEVVLNEMHLFQFFIINDVFKDAYYQ